MPALLLALIVIPIAEIAVFIQVGQWIGLGPTLVGIVLSAIVGAALLRRQGLQTVRAIQDALNRSEVPVRQLFDGMCLFVAGAFLLTPGFITDTIGFLLLVPPIRAVIGRRLWEALRRHGHVTMATAGGRQRHPDEPTVIDAEYHEVGEPDQDGDLPPVEDSRWSRRRGR